MTLQHMTESIEGRCWQGGGVSTHWSGLCYTELLQYDRGINVMIDQWNNTWAHINFWPTVSWLTIHFICANDEGGCGCYDSAMRERKRKCSYQASKSQLTTQSNNLRLHTQRIVIVPMIVRSLFIAPVVFSVSTICLRWLLVKGNVWLCACARNIISRTVNTTGTHYYKSLFNNN